jgi:predicted amidohydrolase YtcJ
MQIDAIWTNGRFWTGDAAHPEATTVAVHRGRIVGVDDVNGLTARQTFDLGGARVIPGLHDAHHHLSLTGHRLLMVDLRGMRSLEAIYDALKERADALPADAWVKASGYDQNLFGGEHPTAEGIDGAVSGRPCVVEHVSGHMIVASTRAFELAGFADRQFPDIEGGRVFRTDDGRAVGLLQERAMTPLRDASSQVTVEEALVAIELGSRQAVAYGLTSITEPGVMASGTMHRHWADLHTYQLAVETGQVLPRMTVMPFHTSLHPLDGLDDWLTLDLGIRSGFGDDRLRLGPVKILSDGSLIGRSAAVHQCYCGEPDNMGVLQMAPAELRDAFLAIHSAGWTIAAHAIGDRAIDQILDCVEEAQRREPRDVRHRIEHFAIASDQQVRRCAELGVIPVPQGVFISDFGDGIIEAIGAERSAETYRMRSLLDAGMVVPGSTDSPISDANPFVCMRDLVLRTTASGQDFARHERVTVDEAVRAYTYGSAYAVNREHELGRLREGFLADFVVLSDDIFSIDPARIGDLRADATIIGGQQVYGAPITTLD